MREGWQAKQNAWEVPMPMSHSSPPGLEVGIQRRWAGMAHEQQSMGRVVGVSNISSHRQCKETGY